MLFLWFACLSFTNDFSIDNDGDGFTEYEGDCNDKAKDITPVECIDQDGDSYPVSQGDCDDSNPYTYPGAAELESSVFCMKDEDEDGYGDSTIQ